MSRGWPLRRNGVYRTSSSSRCFSSGMSSAVVQPVPRALTRMLWRPHSTANDRVKDNIPA